MHKKNYFVLIALFSIILYFPLISAETTFIRGDANSDNKVDISDQTFIFKYIYLGGETPKCLDAADVDDNGKIEMTDGVYLIDYLFRGSGKPPIQPYPNGGVDTTNDNLSCGEQEGEGGALSGNVRLQISQSIYCSKELQNLDEVKVSGYFDLPLNYKDKCKVGGADSLLFNVLVTLYENDPWPAPDDFISDQDSPFLNPTNDCSKVNFEVSDFPTVDFGSQGDGAEGNTIEVFARVKLRYWILGETKPREEVGDIDSSERNIDLVDCKCLPLDRYGLLPKGSCCTTIRPYQFKPSGTQPENQQDIYACTESNYPPTQNDQIKLLDYYCNGQDAQTHGPTSSVAANCGVCSYCSAGDSQCKQHDGKEVCGTTDCDNKDTDCRDYSDVGSACIQGTCTQQSCIDFEDKLKETSCNNNNGKCDGAGTCYACTDHGAIMCYNNDEYWAKKCGPTLEKQELKKDCGEDSCENTWFPYCEGDDLKEKQTCYSKGCDNQCYSEKYENTRFVKKCEWGCFGNQCKPNPNVKCSSEFDCPKKESNPYCSEGNVIKDYTIYKCENPGTSSSYCKETNMGETIIQTCSCGCSNAACVSPCPTCSDKIKNQDETDIDCGGNCANQGKKCVDTESCKIGADCQSNYCNLLTLKCENAPSCNNKCSTQGSTRCSSSLIQQTCGNYDADSCLEWGSDISCTGGCSNNQCNFPDLIVPSFIMQYPRTTTAKVGESISIAFTIKNQGLAPANNIFWKLEEPGHFTRTNKKGISLLPGSLTPVFISTSYNSPGMYTAKVTLDPNNNIKETNDDNNQKTLTITIV